MAQKAEKNDHFGEDGFKSQFQCQQVSGADQKKTRSQSYCLLVFSIFFG